MRSILEILGDTFPGNNPGETRHPPVSSAGSEGGVVRPNVGSVPPEALKIVRVSARYDFTGPRGGRIRAPAVAGMGAPSVPSQRTHLSTIPAMFGYIYYDKTEIDSEACEKYPCEMYISLELDIRQEFNIVFVSSFMTLSLSTAL